MANPTTNYGFVLPTSTDLVTDLPADFDVALQGVDTRLKALQPGTTLGDLAYSSATANTNTRLGIGSTGNVLTVAGGVPTWSAPAAAASGLTLVKTQTIGTTVSSVEVTGAFSATYDNYLITISGGVASATIYLYMQLGSTTTGYYGHSVGGSYASNTVNGFAQSNGANFIDIGAATTSTIHSIVTLLSPNLAKETTLTSNYVLATTSSSQVAVKHGYLNDTTQYTAFTIITSSGTLTGGKIRVYGYQNS